MSLPNPACFYIKKRKKKRVSNNKVTLYLAVRRGYEDTHTSKREPYVLYVVGVESPKPFQGAEPFSCTP